MRRAAAITAEAHVAAMRAIEPGLREYEVEAVLDCEFRRRGARGAAYPSIVGSGANACVLHYTRNSGRLRSGDLVLIDAGCEYELYSSDVTRTLPVDGRFSRDQRALYDLVLAAQKSAIAAVKPGVPVSAPHAAALEVLCEGMVDLGLLSGTPAEVRQSGAYRRYFMHRTSHWLGLDVHDTSGEGRAAILEPGMVLTVEPGLYVGARERSAPARLRGMGIRIEDDVLVTRAGREVLTRDAPKDPGAVERAMRGGAAPHQRVNRRSARP
jgi:Xaa-Pro aminopeptidase